jgi:hypothetical protein
MHKHKIVNFEKTSGGKFPYFRELDPGEAKIVKGELSTKIISKFGIDIDTLLARFDRFGEAVNGVNAQSDDFTLKSLFELLSIIPRGRVFINWYRFDDIDEMSLDDFSIYFDDIWYPGSDDIDIFDSTKTWIISISHDGYVKLFDLQ